ncbi:Exocyst complex component EXO70A1 [Histomonas meleagridis]|uniref:Exocyst complex component EXO70A1 n=1 Tax=Histomonas meleagridis TaxID=135588 RepID=UPI003559751A|nr:Exocyst complex component EXO70A1 [Histomonas meleagridis]KAH0803729.1 Exocyst complex component EXO70A1 [Histomonas meleagridis]
MSANQELSNLADPTVQHQYLKNLRDVALTKLPALDSSINRFISRFDQQKDALSQLYDKTQNEQRILTNIVATHEALQKIVDLLNKDTTFAPVINSQVETNFENYLKTMGEIKVALSLLEKLKFKESSNSRFKIQALYATGESSLLSYFESIVSKKTDPFPISYFDFVDDKFTILNEELRENITYPITDEEFSQLSAMSKLFAETKNKIHYRSYTNTRNAFIDATLSRLQAKSSKRYIDTGEPDVIQIPSYDHHSHPIHLYIFTLHYLIKREISIAKRIFGSEYMIPLRCIIGPTYESLFKVTEQVHFNELNSHTDILFDLDLFSTLKKVESDPLDVPETDENSPFLKKFIDALEPIRGTIKTTFDKFIHGVEKHDTNMIPNGGDISPLTSNVLLFLGDLCIYSEALKGTPGYSLETVATKSVKALLDNLSSKAKHYQDPIVTQLFFLNNGHYSYSAIQKYGLDSYISQDILTRIEDLIQKSQETYIKLTWDTAFAKLAPKEQFGEIKRLPNGHVKLNKKQRMTIKRQFRDFLKLFEEFQNKHEKYCIKYKKYMAPILNEVVRKINTIYEPFYTKWKDSNFSRTPEKWITYPPATTIQLVNQLYSGQAK